MTTLPLKYTPSEFANNASGDMLINLDPSICVYMLSRSEWSLGFIGGVGMVLTKKEVNFWGGAGGVFDGLLIATCDLFCKRRAMAGAGEGVEAVKEYPLRLVGGLTLIAFPSNSSGGGTLATVFSSRDAAEEASVDWYGR
jgi:hypothetical protein